MKHVTNWHPYRKMLPTDGSKNTLPSKTQPDQSMGLREILHRFTTGKSLDESIVREPHFSNNDHDFDALDMNEFSQLDFNDREQLRREIVQRRDELRKAAEEEMSSWWKKKRSESQKLNHDSDQSSRLGDEPSQPREPKRKDARRRSKDDPNGTNSADE